MQLGTLYGVGVGPGDPELLTLKGWRLLKAAPVVAFPAGIKGQPGIAQTIVAEWLRSDQVHLPLTFPYVHDAAVLTQAWQTAAAQVWEYLAQGQDVVFLSEGDVSFYSTFTYLSQTLHLAHPEVCIETIPGICSPLAAAATLGIPLTLREQRLVVLPAVYQVAELEAVLQWAEVVVLLKVSSVYQQVWSVLQRYQLLDRSYVVERATTAAEKIYRGLANHPTLELPYFSLLIIQVTDPETVP